jgi:hypothetical protein
MELLRKAELEAIELPGRTIWKAIGKDGPSVSKKMTMGFARYSQESGPMEPHHHAEEIIYVLAAENGTVRWGESKENLDKVEPLHPGMILHFPELEWHVFEYQDDGYIDVIFFYGQVDNIRPEEISKNR